MNVSSLEISLRPLPEGDYEVSLRFQAPNSHTDAYLVEAPLPRASFAIERLLLYHLDPISYGQQLTQMLFADTRLVAAFSTARTYAESTGTLLRISLRLDANNSLLHSLRWETLHDPERGGALFSNERIVLVRTIESAHIQPIIPRTRSALNALVVIASPSDLMAYQLAPINVVEELERCIQVLGSIPVSILVSGTKGPVTLARLRAALNDMHDIVYLVCHGVNRMGQTLLWLEDEEGKCAPVDGEVFVRQIAALNRRPILVVLAACESAGSAHDESALISVAPHLAREGVAAVVAMIGKVTQITVARAMPIFFQELIRDGRVDRAISAARGAVLDRDDWWSLSLLLRLQDGRLWLDDNVASGASIPTAPDTRSRQRVLQYVRDYWVSGVLEHSLHGAALIALGMKEQPELVAYPWDVVVESRGRTVRNIPPGTSLDSVFDDLGGELLILGTPGSGKTTMLLDLARVLLERAERDAQFKIPVVLHLSLWAENRQSLREWIISELDERYGVPRPIGTEWLTNNRIIPLLDGLDEVKLEYRNGCVVAVNDFWKEYGAGLVICSRIADYEALTERLRLRGAVLLQPLTEAQVELYLQHAGPQLTGLREFLPEDPALRELSTSPLMLSVMTLAYQGQSKAIIRATFTNKGRQNQLFASYVQRMLARRRTGEERLLQRMVDQLAWMARGMVQHSQSVFFLDELQPTWIPSAQGRWGYAVGSSVLIILLCVIGGYIIGATLAAFSVLIAKLFFNVSYTVGSAAIVGGGFGALSGGIAGGLHLGITAPGFGLHGVLGRIYKIKRVFWEWERLRDQLQFTSTLRNGIIIGTVLGSTTGLYVGRQIQNTLIEIGEPINFALLAAPLVSITYPTSNALLLASCLAVGVLLLGLITSSVRRWLLARFARGNKVAGALSRLLVPVTHEIIGGGAAGLVISFVFTMLLFSGGNFYRGLFVGGAFTMPIAVLAFLYIRLVNCSKYNSSDPYAVNATYSTGWIASAAVKVTILTLVSGIVGGGVAFLAAWALWSITENASNPYSLIYLDRIYRWESWVLIGALTFSIGVGLFTLLTHGVKSFLQRLWLRYILAISGGINLRARTLLDTAADRILLRKVGDGYIFVHRLILEYFAELNPSNSNSMLGSLSWAVIDRGITLRDLDQNEAAIEAFSQVLEMEPGNSKALQERAMTLRQLGRHEECLRDLNKSIELAHNQYFLRVQRGVTLRILKRYDEALEEFTQAARLEPKPVGALIERSITYGMLQRYDEAIADATKAIQGDPKYGRLRAYRAIAYREVGMLTEAYKDLEFAVEQEPTNNWILTHCGITLRLLGRYENALLDLQRAVEIDPLDRWSRHELMITYRTLNQLDEALEQCNQIIQQYAQKKLHFSDWSYYQRGLIYINKGDRSSGLADFANAAEIVRLQEENTSISSQDRLNLAIYLLALGRGEEARLCVQSVLVSTVPLKLLKDALDDIDEQLTVISDNADAIELRELLQNEYSKIRNQVAHIQMY